MFLPRLCRRYVYSLPILLIAIAVLSSACMWGVVTDATTGAPIVGAKVTVTDQSGQSVTTTTDEQGVFGFSPTDLASLPEGNTSLEAESAGYGTVSRTFYLHNPVATSWNPLAFELLRGSFVYWHDKVTHLSLLFPTGWTITSFNDVAGGGASAPGPDEDTFCTMVPSPITGNGLDSTMESLLTLMGMSNTNMRNSGLVNTAVKGMPAVKTTVSFGASPDSGNGAKPATAERLIYLIGLSDKSAYSISCDTSSTKYGQWEPKFEAIVHSLTLDK